MKTPADGWDREEREALDELQDELEKLQARHQHDPALDLLRAARHDALPPDLQSSVEHHLSQDPWSRTLVDGLDNAEPSLNQADQGRLLARIHRAARGGTSVAHSVWLRPILATAAVVVLGVAAWFASRTASPAIPASPIQPEQTIASTPTPTAFLLPLDKPDVALSLSALTWRGSSKANQLLTDLKAPLDAFREGDYTQADREFTVLESKYPQAIEVFFYGGVSRLFVNDPERARAALARASELADESFAPLVNWYRAIAEQRAGRVAEARSRLETLCRGSSERAAQACEAVKQIDAASGTPHAR